MQPRSISVLPSRRAFSNAARASPTASWEDCLSFYIQCIGLKAALVSGLGQPDRIEDARRHAVAIGGAQDLRFAGLVAARDAGGQAR